MSSHAVWLLVPVLSFPAAAGGTLVAQETPSERAVRSIDELELRELGPALMGGRIADLAVDESNPGTFYVGFASGGVWKTTSDGMSWEPVFDDQPTASIGDVTLAPSNPNVVWVGTGEPQNRQSSPWGVGVFRSTDGGRTWRHLGLEETRHIARIAVHPGDPDVAYVAAVGHLWGPNEERGVYRTTDGGGTWERVLYVDEDTGAIDLVMDPGDPRTLFAATYQRRRTGFGFAAGGGGSGMWRTLDGGDTWTRPETGLPEGEMGRIGLDVYRGDGNLVYATVEAKEGGTGLYRSTDRGESWEKVSDRNPRPMYFSLVRIDPNNPERIYLGGTSLSISDDGGKTWWDGDAAEGIHVDHHALWIDPEDSNHVLLGSDGGLSTSRDAGRHWRHIDNVAVGQFYEVGYDMRDPYYVCGGLQDNGNWCGPTNSLTTYGVRNSDWYMVWSGDGFYNVPDPTDPDIVYTESQGGFLARYHVPSGDRQSIRPLRRDDDEPAETEAAEAAEPPVLQPEPVEAAEAEAAGAEEQEEEEDEDEGYRFNWNAPIAVSSHDAATIYFGANHLMRSRDRGMSWEEASPDLTKAIDRDTLPIMGMETDDETLSRHDGISTYGNITTIAESKRSPDVIYVGTDDGNLQVTTDGGATWTNVADRVPDLPPRTYVSRLETSRHADGRVYASFDGHRNDDYRAYVYVSEDHGQSWRSIAAGLPDGWSVNTVREHHRNPELLFVGNEIGVFVSIDRGASWGRLGANFPTVPVDDIQIHPRENDLIVGTHGRSIWILDDLAPLEEASEALASEVYLFSVRPSTIRTVAGGWPFQGDRFQASNPPNGAIIRYRLSEPFPEPDSREGEGGEVGGDAGVPEAGAAAGETGAAAPDEEAAAAPLRIELLDASGEVLRTLDAPHRAGVRQVVWDFAHDPPFEGGGGGGGFFGGSTSAPRVVPGTYTVRLVAGDVAQETPVEIRMDPRLEVTAPDIRARFDAQVRIDRLRKPLRDANERLDEMDDRVEQIRALLDAADLDDETRTSLDEAVGAFTERLEEVEEDLDDANLLGNALFGVALSNQRPTADQAWAIDRTWAEAPPVLERVNALLTDDLPALEERLRDAGVRPKLGEPIEIPDPDGGV